MHKTLQILAAIGLLSLSGIAAAGPSTPGIDVREQRQAGRIAHGVATGELTRLETRRLVGQQRQNARLERAFKADGHVSRGERQILHHRLDRSSRAIHRQKHDRNLR